MALFSCNHSWGFPRRRADFAGQPNVDVQTCSKCGAQRISPVQFGPAATTAQEPKPKPQQFMEVQA
jgi:hypothetical protein